MYRLQASTTFDSYSKGKDQNGDNVWYSEYGGDNQNKHHVDYDGIGVKEVLDSSLFPYALNIPTYQIEYRTQTAHSGMETLSAVHPKRSVTVS